MAKHNVLGNEGEQLAVQWLQRKGYTLLEQNWRYSYYEIDIIASLEDVLHVIEVKTRRTKKFGEPEESIDKKKMLNLMKAAEVYQQQNQQWKRLQYDVLAITIEPGATIEYFFIEDVYL